MKIQSNRPRLGPLVYLLINTLKFIGGNIIILFMLFDRNIIEIFRINQNNSMLSTMLIEY